MYLKDEYLDQQPDGTNIVYYNPVDGTLVSKWVKTGNLPSIIISDKDSLPKFFPIEFIGKKFIDEHGSIVDNRHHRFEYKVDLLTKTLRRFDFLEDYINGENSHESLLEALLKSLETDYRTLVSKSDFISSEYYKQILFPEYEVDASEDDIKELKKAPQINKKYNTAKKWLLSLKENASLIDKEEFVSRALEILSYRYLEND